MTVAHIIKEKGNRIVSVEQGDSIMSACKTLAQQKVGCVLVMDESGALAGVLSERDVARNLPHYGPALVDMPVLTIMTANVITCDYHDSIARVMELMTSKRIRHLPVMDDGNLCGMVSIGDVVKQKIAQAEAEAESLKEYIATG